MARHAFNKILIANRGEIAVRVIRACRELGIRTVAVYSAVDRAALHVLRADEACLLHPESSSAGDTYLNIERILEVARHCGAQAIHPGYGFLSENAEFAGAAEAAGIKFIGPRAAAMELMGSKTNARRAMQSAGVPFVPGSTGAVATLDEARAVAAEIGFPVMLKAAAGGGGKGMRLVRRPAELPSAFEAARSEALRAFGDDEVYIERLLERPRHIEIQVLADEHGNCVYLGERECSVQRRHQKVIEEAPSAAVSPAMRQAMGETAVRVAQAAAYTNAGTVEFLVDAAMNFYFLEMNTRLQVEHPVTELTTGLDLVKLQIQIAAGERLPFSQADIALRGHAIECRIYAEDPENNFLPSPGVIGRLIAPAGPGIREDSGIYEGFRVPLEYDPLLSKLIAYGATRQEALERLRRAVDEYFLGGIRHNLPLFRRVLRDPAFAAAEIDTGYLDRLLQGGLSQKPDEEAELVAAIAAAIFEWQHGEEAAAGSETANPDSPWKRAARQEGMRS
ncbi:MAG: acetyl-CoA carboxylase biotin carboxylase subunit [Acidobacteria bacterium]|nr:acetyl-CoA carboxylase biotin carboxylase subunit [Acidobacteriota bacterium]